MDGFPDRSRGTTICNGKDRQAWAQGVGRGSNGLSAAAGILLGVWVSLLLWALISTLAFGG